MSTYQILVVEDSETSGLLMQSLFEENEKYKVSIATNGSSALKKVKDIKPDLILLDIMLPGLDGFSILKRLKIHSETASIPVVIVSSKDKPTDIEHGKELGAIDYIVKPIGVNKLYERVNKIIDELETKDVNKGNE